MNVWNKLVFFIAFLISLNYVFGINICGVDISEPWFKVNDSDGNDVFIVDKDGDMYFKGISHVDTPSTITNLDTFKIYNLYFNNEVSYLNGDDVHDSVSSLDTSIEGTYISDSGGNKKTLISKNGVIYTLGKAAYQGNQAGCSSDGIYCSGTVRQTRDYFCDILSGSCTHSSTFIEDCSTKNSVDSDSDYDPLNYGVVKDYSDCSSGDCTFINRADSCNADGNTLYEKRASGASYTSTSVNCDATYSGSNFCDSEAGDVYKVKYGCSSGECEVVNNMYLVQDCKSWEKCVGASCVTKCDSGWTANGIYCEKEIAYPSVTIGGNVRPLNPNHINPAWSRSGMSYCNDFVKTGSTYARTGDRFGSDTILAECFESGTCTNWVDHWVQYQGRDSVTCQYCSKGLDGSNCNPSGQSYTWNPFGDGYYQYSCEHYCDIGCGTCTGVSGTNSAGATCTTLDVKANDGAICDCYAPKGVYFGCGTMVPLG